MHINIGFKQISPFAVLERKAYLEIKRALSSALFYQVLGNGTDFQILIASVPERPARFSQQNLIPTPTLEGGEFLRNRREKGKQNESFNFKHLFQPYLLFKCMWLKLLKSIQVARKWYFWLEN